MRTYTFCILGIVLVCLVGCTRQSVPTDLPKLIPCQLIFTQDGQPLADARIVLEPAEESKWFPGGTTDKNGTAVLMTNGRYKGAPTGQYKITVKKTETEPSKLPPEPSADSPNHYQWLIDYSMEKRASFSLVEEKYSSVETTPLEIAISGSRTVTETFDVGKSVREPLKITVIKEK